MEEEFWLYQEMFRREEELMRKIEQEDEEELEIRED